MVKRINKADCQALQSPRLLSLPLIELFTGFDTKRTSIGARDLSPKGTIAQHVLSRVVDISCDINILLPLASSLVKGLATLLHRWDMLNHPDSKRLVISNQAQKASKPKGFLTFTNNWSAKGLSSYPTDPPDSGTFSCHTEGSVSSMFKELAKPIDTHLGLNRQYWYG